MTDEEIRAFSNWLTLPGALNGGDHEVAVCMRESGCWYGIKRLLFHYTVTTGVIGDRDSIEDRWCYETWDKASLAFAEWTSRKFEGEPEGWHRHPKSGRRRPGGDAKQEYVAD